MIGSIPFYIGLGGHKCASTWIYSCLFEHPEICIPQKDIHFFALDHLFENGYEWYEHNINKHYEGERCIVDFSVLNFSSPKSAERIFSRYPDLKLFACLRNPVDRAWSHYLQDLKKGHIEKSVTFEDALELDPRYIQYGKYKSHYGSYLSYFKKNQIAIFSFKALQNNPSLFIQNLYSYFEVDSQFEPSVLNRKLNKAHYPRFRLFERINTEISWYLKKSKLGQRIWWIIKQSGVPEFVRKLNSGEAPELSQMSKRVRKKLEEEFEEDILFLSKIEKDSAF